MLLCVSVAKVRQEKSVHWSNLANVLNQSVDGELYYNCEDAKNITIGLKWCQANVPRLMFYVLFLRNHGNTNCLGIFATF